MLQHGYIHTANDQYFIEPVKGHDRKSSEGHPHLIYKRSALTDHPYNVLHSDDDDAREKGTCGVQGRNFALKFTHSLATKHSHSTTRLNT